MSINNIRNYITKFKNTNDINKAYREFKYSWLDYVNQNSKNKILIELDIMKFEYIHGDGDYDKEIIEAFIKTLDDMLNTLS
jgi:CRISPR/Cas system CSM-associated protein Csm2 small subunit